MSEDVQGAGASVDALRLLLERGCDVNSVCDKGYTPLHYAAKSNRLHNATILLENEAKTNVTAQDVILQNINIEDNVLIPPEIPRFENVFNEEGESEENNSLELFNEVNHSREEESNDEESGLTPLHLAAEGGYAGMAALLLHHGADPNSRAENGFTPLHVCAKEGKLNVAVVLTEYGSDFNALADGGKTPLHIASEFGHLNIVKFLCKY